MSLKNIQDSMTSFFARISPTISRLGENKYLQTISGTMMSTLGPIMVGSIAVLMLAFPIEGVKNAITSMGLMPVFAAVNSVTIGALALYVAFLMGRNLVNKMVPEEDGSVAGALSLMCFLIVTPLDKTAEGVGAIPTTWLGAQGVFSAMIIGLVVGRIYVLFRQKDWSIKMPDSVPPMVTKTFDSLFPCFTVGLLAIIVSRIFLSTGYGSMHQFIYSIIQVPLQGLGGSLPATLLTSLLMQILWFFGIHGTNVIAPIVQPIRLALDSENMTALAAGVALPNIVGNGFFSIICWGGSALGLVLLMLRSKSKQYRQLGKVAIVPALFGITEPVIFGTPLVFNFKFLIPFVTNNTINLCIAYALTNMGIVGRCSGVQPIFGLPLGFHAMVSGQISVVILQLVLQLIISPLLWYPWFKMAEKEALAKEQAE